MTADAATAVARARVAVASDPRGGRHVLASAVHRGGRRAGRFGLADLGSRSGDARGPGALGGLLATTRLSDDGDLADLLAHLVPLPAPHEPAGGDTVVEVCAVTADAALPESVDGPVGRRFVLRVVAPPGGLDGAALLFANAHAPEGPWWAPVGAPREEVLRLGATLAGAGLFGADARASCAVGDLDLPTGAARPQVAVQLEAHLRGVDAAADPEGPSVTRAETGDGVEWEVTAGEAAPTRWRTVRWRASTLAELDAVRGSRLFPYWLLVVEDAGDGPALTRVANARRTLAGAWDLAGGLAP